MRTIRNSKFYIFIPRLYVFLRIARKKMLKCCNYVFILITLAETVFHSDNTVAFCNDINNHTAEVCYIVYLALQECPACEVGYTCKVPIQIFILWNSMTNMN